MKLQKHQNQLQGFWNKIGHYFFSKIQQGHLQVTYDNGTTFNYGNRNEPSSHLHLKNHKIFKKLFLYGDIGFAESYMDNDFEVDDLTKLIEIALINTEYLHTLSEYEKLSSLYNLVPYFNRLRHKLHKNSKKLAKRNISQHYDLSNHFFSLMLDKTMMYSSAVFQSKTDSLEEAQRYKIKKLAEKLNINSKSKVLEIGSGWGAMSSYLAQEIGCEVVSLTLSEEQKKYCDEQIKKESIDNLTILVKDYRDMQGKFDAILAVEMFEAVGKEYFHQFFKKCEQLLVKSGVMVLQVITVPDQRYECYQKDSDFIRKYIFPGGHLPSLKSLLKVTHDHTRFNLLGLEDFTEHYAKTLQIWKRNFNEKIDKVIDLDFDDYFIRMWNMYLSYCQAGFLTRNINLLQVVFTRDQNMSLNQGLL